MDVLLDGRTQLVLNSLLQLAFPALSMKEASPCSSYFLTQSRRLRSDIPFALASIQSAACFLFAIKNPPKAVWWLTLSAFGGSYQYIRAFCEVIIIREALWKALFSYRKTYLLFRLIEKNWIVEKWRQRLNGGANVVEWDTRCQGDSSLSGLSDERWCIRV